MRKRTVFLGGACLLAAGAAILVLRAVAYRPDPRPEPPVVLAAETPIDLAAAAAHLGQAIRFQTVSHQDPQEDDPTQWDQQRAWLTLAYPHFHAVARREIVGGGALLYTWRGADPTLAPVILMAHQDVVPVSAETLGRWRAPPFSGAVRDGAVWGRGSLDDKGSLVAIMEASEALAARGYRPKRTLIIVSGEHEETSGGSVPKVAALLAKRDVHALFVLDEGLMILNANPVTGKPAALIGVAEKGYATLKVTAFAPGGHSSTPPKETAVLTLAKAITAIAAKPFPLSLDGPTGELLRALSDQMTPTVRLAAANAWLFGPLIAQRFGATPEGAAELHTTIAPTMLQGSPKENVLPDRAVALVNYRLFPGDSSASVLEKAREATQGLKVRLAFQGPVSEASPVSSSRSGAYRVIAALAEDMEKTPSAPALMIGATDSKAMTPVATDIYRFTFIRQDVKDIAMFHGVGEHMTLDNLSRLTRFFTRLIATTTAG